MGSCLEAPPCTPVLLTECRRRSPLLPHPPLRSRSLLLPRGSTLYGSVAPSWPLCPPSSRCGSPSRSTMSAAHPLSTGSASKLKISQYCDILCHVFQIFCLDIMLYEGIHSEIHSASKNVATQ